jgi:outer membrane lipoprotein carrier protein
MRLNSPALFKMPAAKIFLMLLITIVSGVARAQSDNSDALLNSWLAAQTNIQTWTADFTQTRNLKALTQPLTAKGKVWFAAPNRFRWEIEKPSPTIAVREPDELWVIYPRLKRAEEYPLNSADAGPWKDTLALLDAGFPRSRAEVEARFNIIKQTTTGADHELTLQPKAETARRFMPEIKITFDTTTFALRSTELIFADGSSMKNAFENPVLNPKIEDSVFKPEVAGYKIIQPFKK